MRDADTTWLDWDAMRSRDVIKLSYETTIWPPPWADSQEKKGLSHRFLARSSLSIVSAGETNENVRRNRIIHCPTKTGGASCLFGERIHLVRATAILDEDRAKCFSDPGDSTFRFVLCQIHFEKRSLLYPRVTPFLYYYTISLLHTQESILNIPNIQ